MDKMNSLMKDFHENRQLFKNAPKMYSNENARKQITAELGTFEWWISGLRLDPLFFLISRLNNACSPLVINLHIDKPIQQTLTVAKQRDGRL